MFEGYRDGRFALGLMIGIGATLLLVSWLASTDCQIDPANQDCRPQTNATNDIGVVPISGQGMPTGQIDAPDTEADPKYYERHDLKAQEGMAESTKWIVWLTGGSMFLSLVGAGLLVWTLRETRRTSFAAVKANKIARKVGENQVRAYVHIEKVSLIDGTLWDWLAVVEIKNFGQTPARLIRSKINCGVYTIGEDAFPIGEPTEITVEDLGPGQQFGIPVLIEFTEIDEANQGPKPQTKHFRIGGAINYFDVFGRPKETKFDFATDPLEFIKIGSPMYPSSSGNSST